MRDTNSVAPRISPALRKLGISAERTGLFQSNNLANIPRPVPWKAPPMVGVGGAPHENPPNPNPRKGDVNGWRPDPSSGLSWCWLCSRLYPGWTRSSGTAAKESVNQSLIYDDGKINVRLLLLLDFTSPPDTFPGVFALCFLTSPAGKFSNS